MFRPKVWLGSHRPDDFKHVSFRNFMISWRSLNLIASSIQRGLEHSGWSRQNLAIRESEVTAH
jgi:hypothetical protein